ncbi:MFS transporter [Bacillus sp. FJAT-49736]|uniref:MDR family MFS transporter n=1 Tax=Bacillus sp. FJAT-49736 TaxID=2833582 RepID=UPI001BC91F9B|nr:MFS transporter [Bacillus sp. FJAT-49736]MBS4175028.1 MFS transporter [Bacillus sp. FJAT-49736]
MRIRDWDQNLKIRLIGESMMNLTFWMFFPFLTIYFTEAFGKNTAGVLLIVSQVFSVIANLLGGYYADRFGRKKMMVIAAIGQGTCFLIFGFSNSPWFESHLISFFCFSIASMFGSLYYPASQAMVADVVKEKDRSDVFAIFYTSTNITVVIGPILGGIFFTNYRFELLVIAGAVCICLGMLLLKYTRETSPALLNGKNTYTENNWLEIIISQFKSYSIILKDRIFLLFIIAGILVSQTFMQLDLLFPVFTKETVTKATLFDFGTKHISVTGEQLFGIILSENGFLVALFTVIVTRWMAKYKEKYVFMLSSITYALSIYFFGQFPFVWGFIISMAIFSFAELMVTGIQQSFISKLAPEEMRGQYFAAASLRYTIGRTIAPISIPLASMLGYYNTFIVLAFISIISAGLYGLVFRQFDIQRSKQA